MFGSCVCVGVRAEPNANVMNEGSACSCRNRPAWIVLAFFSASQSMVDMGNNRARLLYEAHLPDGFQRPQTDQYPRLSASSTVLFSHVFFFVAFSAKLLESCLIFMVTWALGVAGGEESFWAGGLRTAVRFVRWYGSADFKVLLFFFFFVKEAKRRRQGTPPDESPPHHRAPRDHLGVRYLAQG